MNIWAVIAKRFIIQWWKTATSLHIEKLTEQWVSNEGYHSIDGMGKWNVVANF